MNSNAKKVFFALFVLALIVLCILRFPGCGVNPSARYPTWEVDYSSDILIVQRGYKNHENGINTFDKYEILLSNGVFSIVDAATDEEKFKSALFYPTAFSVIKPSMVDSHYVFIDAWDSLGSIPKVEYHTGSYVIAIKPDGEILVEKPNKKECPVFVQNNELYFIKKDAKTIYSLYSRPIFIESKDKPQKLLTFDLMPKETIMPNDMQTFLYDEMYVECDERGITIKGGAANEELGHISFNE